MASTTFIDNQTTIFADWLNDVNNAVYSGTFPNGSLSLTTLNVTGAVTGAGFTSLINNSLSAPGAIGSATPNTGAFTTLSATTLSSTTLNTTAITGLTTPLSRAQGGTGLSAAGTTGNVLTSDGTNWTSAASQTVGVGQTWQTVTRVNNTNYTNSTSKPIAVSAWVANLPTNNNVTMFVDNVEVAAQGNATGTSGWTVSLFTIVPPNSVYKIVATAGTISCAELR
jgi:hypothetical protein